MINLIIIDSIAIFLTCDRRQLEEVQSEDYAAGEFIAVRWADPPNFWLARVEEDKGKKYGFFFF